MFLELTTADVLPHLAQVLGAVEMQRPDDEDVKAGWIAFAMFGLGILAVALLGRSLYVQLRKVEVARRSGVYGPVETDDDSSAATAGSASAGSPAGETENGDGRTPA